MAPFWPLGRWRWLVEGCLWLLIAVCVGLPFASLAATSLVPAYGVPLAIHTITLDNFTEVLLRQEVTKRAFRTSLLLAGATAIITAGLAMIVAYGLERHVKKGRQLAESLLEIPYALPGIVLGISCILLFLKPLPLIGVSMYGTPFIILFAYLARFQALAVKAPLATMALLARD